MSVRYHIAVKKLARRGVSVMPHDIGYALQRDNVTARERRAWVRLHHCGTMFRSAAVPWRYDRYFSPNTNQHQTAMKIQPGAQVPVSFNGVNTLMYIDTARRLNHHGKPTWIEMKIKLDTENLPIILTNETKCDCVYCGTSPRGDETSCRGCGAPLDC